MNFCDRLRSSRVVLTEGALIERLRRDPAARLDPHVLHAGMIYDPLGRAKLAALYRQYLDIGRDFRLPMILGTPTWRANPERLQAAGFADPAAVNADGFRFVAGIRTEYGAYAEGVYVGGLVGCRGDAYQPAEALPAGEAAAFHEPQVRTLAVAGVDFLMAATLPAVCEALGIARAMAACGVPYVLSFVVRPTGTLLDDTPLAEAVAQIDAAARPPPLAYAVNCVHPRVFAQALLAAMRTSPDVKDRVLGLQANTSALSPQELDHLGQLDSAEPEPFAQAMLDVHEQLGTRILGGCCGTDDRHIRCLAQRIRAAAQGRFAQRWRSGSTP